MPTRFIRVSALLVFAALAPATVPQTAQDPVVEFTRREIASTKTYRPVAGYVPDSSTAVAIATAVLAPIYGKAQIESERPWHTGLKKGVWTVVGTFHGPGPGGSAVIQLDKKTGTVLFVGHTQ